MIFLTLSFLLYFAPALLATSRRAPNATAIWLTNFFVGWTIIGWIITLLWALNTPPAIYAVPVAVAPFPGSVPAPTAYTAAVPHPAPFGPDTAAYASEPAAASTVPGWAAVDGPTRTCVACGRAVPSAARFCPACGSVESRLG